MTGLQKIVQMPQPNAARQPGGIGKLAQQRVARIGYGAMQLGRLRTERIAAVALLEQAISIGVNHFDTAQFYGDGFVNRAIGEVTARHRDVVVATKVGADPNPGARIPLKLAQRPEQLRVSVDDNLRSLGIEQLPVVNLRRPDAGPGAPAEGNQVVDLDDQLATMCALRDEGKIGAIGLSSVTKEGLRRALPAGIVCVQNPYSLAARDDEELVKICLDANIAWVPYVPLGSAFPAMPKVTDQPEVQNAAAAVGATPAQIGLAWLLAHAPNVLLIPGTSQAKHLHENVAAGSIELDAQILASLDKVAAPYSGVADDPSVRQGK